jgi:membrane protease YdiL (CAAX protease family)
VWGLMQQFFVESLVAGNLERLGAPRAAVIPVAAILFGLAHAPDVPLMALCAGAGLVWTSIFLRFPNLVPISLTHAWLGSLAYLMILERNPWAEMGL